jgi:hypothetical protein
VKALLSRPNHREKAQLGSSKARPAVTSTYMLPYEESWYFMLADTSGNWVLAAKEKVALLGAEAAGFQLDKAALVTKDGAAAPASGTQVVQRLRTLLCSPMLLHCGAEVQ